MEERCNRRTFLFGTAGTVAGACLTSPASARRRAQADRIRLGIIGVGGRGEDNWRNLAGEDVRALCDVDLSRVANAVQRFPQAEVVQDFRKILDRKDIDAVVISTPDHWHAIPSVWAMETGKHVYCEKPLAHTIYEARVMAETARRHKVVTQMGIQIHAGSNYPRVVELIRSGVIGPVRNVDVWCEKRPMPGKRVTQGTPPSSLDYEMWVGPAPMHPFDIALIPFHWRWWWEFGGGVLADMGCHFFDLPHWALELGAPEKVSATGKNNAGADNTVPAEMKVDYTYPRKGDRPAVRLTWWHGIPGPRGEDGQVQNLGYRNGVLFHGDKGKLAADYDSYRLLPEEQFAGVERPAPPPRQHNHHQEWANAIRSGGSPSCNFDYGGALTEAVLLGNVSYRLEQPVEWDAQALKVTNARGAERYTHPKYRGEWRLRR